METEANGDSTNLRGFQLINDDNLNTNVTTSDQLSVNAEQKEGVRKKKVKVLGQETREKSSKLR